MKTDASELRSRIQSYLGNGGLFNPEMMEHDKVRSLILDLRDYLDAGQAPTHPYQCPVCFDGTVSKELWEMLYGKNLGMHTCGKSSNKHLSPLKIWIGQQLDDIESHGCQNCWSDGGGKCKCIAERDDMKRDFMMQLEMRLHLQKYSIKDE